MRCFNPCFNGRCKRTCCFSCYTGCSYIVSILVLMEDVKEPQKWVDGKPIYARSFNPCFNGRCKRTLYHTICCQTIMRVSILVLMEDVKEHNWLIRIMFSIRCFNPCFNGRCKRTNNQICRYSCGNP